MIGCIFPHFSLLHFIFHFVSIYFYFSVHFLIMFFISYPLFFPLFIFLGEMESSSRQTSLAAASVNHITALSLIPSSSQNNGPNDMPPSIRNSINLQNNNSNNMPHNIPVNISKDIQNIISKSISNSSPNSTSHVDNDSTDSMKVNISSATGDDRDVSRDGGSGNVGGTVSSSGRDGKRASSRDGLKESSRDSGRDGGPVRGGGRDSSRGRDGGRESSRDGLRDSAREGSGSGSNRDGVANINNNIGNLGPKSALQRGNVHEISVLSPRGVSGSEVAVK